MKLHASLLAAVTAALPAIAACGGSSSSSPAVATTAVTAPGGQPGLPPGVADGALWTCQISDYDPQPCKFEREGDGWRLTKLLGSQRFTGDVQFTTDGTIQFAGQFFCPWGDCDAAMEVTFERGPGAGYLTRFGDDDITLAWNPGNAEEYGGAGYGGLTGRETD